jgi:hypothetical protein
VTAARSRVQHPAHDLFRRLHLLSTQQTAMPWLPAPISQSTCGATCLKSISVFSERRGHRRYDAGRTHFHGEPSRFDSHTSRVASRLPKVAIAIQLQH